MAISVNRLIGITMPTYYEKGYGFYYQQIALTNVLSSFNENRWKFFQNEKLNSELFLPGYSHLLFWCLSFSIMGSPG